jgi:hypothetical protein
MGLKVAGISILCQDARVWDGLWMAGTPCPYLGSIGDAAKAAWVENPSRAPEGTILRLSEVPVSIPAAADDYPHGNEN